jgi:mevalonate kinase
VRQVAEFGRKNPKIIESILGQIKLIVEKAKEELTNHNFKAVGQLMSKNQQLLMELGVSSVELDTLNKAAMEAGAWGAKLSGAGGGDCMIAMVPKINQKQVSKAINRHGRWLEVKLGAEGARLEN